jgi:hypothetical protein
VSQRLAMKGKGKSADPRARGSSSAAGDSRPRGRPASSSIYWESVDSSGGSSASGSRNYVDPWDLENYAYLRRHSIAVASPQPVYQASRNGYGSRASHDSPVESDYWSVLSIGDRRLESMLKGTMTKVEPPAGPVEPRPEATL